VLRYRAVLPVIQTSVDMNIISQILRHYKTPPKHSGTGSDTVGWATGKASGL